MLAFDTHEYIKELKAAGFTEEQAEVQARTLKNIIDNDLASKQSLKELEVALKHEIELIRRDIKALEANKNTQINAFEAKTDTQNTPLESRLETLFKELELRLTLRLGGVWVFGLWLTIITHQVVIIPSPIR